MPVVQAFFNPLNPRHKETYEVDSGGQIIEFLQKEFPVGFNGVLRVFVGIKEIELDDLDYVIQEEDKVTLLILPADPVSAFFTAYVVPALIGAVVGAGVTFILNLIFKPSSPNAAKSEQESPVYSLNATRNASRLGDPIAAHYGSVSYPPDFASAPYQFFFAGGNDQYVDELLCLGHGNFDIKQVYVGDTPVTSIEPGAVQYWIFGPQDHRQQMGVIGNTISRWVQGTAMPWPFRENVFTSPEVENWEFNADRTEAVTSPTPFAGRAFGSYFDNVKQQFIPGRVDEVDATIDIRVGDTLVLAGSTSNNGSFLIGSVVPDPTNSAIMTLYESSQSLTNFVDEDPLNPATTYELNSVADNTVAGPFRAQKEGQIIEVVECDIIFPQGLYRVDGSSGAIKDWTVEMEFKFQPILDDGTPNGVAIIQTQTYNANSRNPMRFTHSSLPIAQSAYEVTVRRITAPSDDDRVHDIVSWVGLKGKIVNSTDPTYGDTTIMAIRLKATNGLGQAARSRVRVTAERILDNGIDSSNPITVIKDIWTNADYGLNRDINELDLTELDQLEEDWSGADGPKFNGSFDKRGTGFDAMQNVASMTGSKVVQLGGLTTIVLDRQQNVRTALFTSGNIIKNSMVVRYNFDTVQDYDGVQVEYRNSTNFQAEFVRYPANSKNPDTYVLFGSTDGTYAQQFARYLNNVKKIRRKQINFQTELEGLIPRFGDRIAIAHPMPSWGQSGTIVEAIDDVTFRVDQYLNWADGVDNVMILRSQTGTLSSQYTVTRGALDNIVIFPEVPDVTVFEPGSQEPTSYTFGEDGNLTSDFILSKITPKSDTVVEIEGQTYTANIFTGAPPHMSL